MSIYTAFGILIILLIINFLGVEPAVRDFHSAVVLNDRMYIFGGRGTESRHSLYLPGKEIYCDELWYLDLNAHIWHNPFATGKRPIGRRSHSACKNFTVIFKVSDYN